jgi:hypothetical protein
VKVIEGQTSIPSDFPKDVPLYPGETVDMVNYVPESDTFVLQAHCPDSLPDVEQKFQQESAAQGWTDETPPKAVRDLSLRALVFTKSGRILQVMLIRNDNGTIINVVTRTNPATPQKP